MQCRHELSERANWWAILMLGVLLPLGMTAPTAAADPFEKLDTAARFVPSDAAFFYSFMRNREQFDIVTQSNAWQKLKAMPFVQMGMAVYNLQALDTESVPGQINAALRDPEQKKLLDLVAEMVSDEMFVYGDQSLVGSVALMQQINGAMRYGPMVLQLGGETGEFDQNQVQGVLLLAVLAENIDLIRVPELVMGFRIKSTDNAAAQLERLEKLVRKALDEEPELTVEVGRKTVAGVEYLTFTVPVRKLPWDELPLDNLEELETEPGDAKKVLAKVQSLEVVVAMGVRDDYVLLSVGPSTDVLEKLGQGTSLLAREEMKLLAPFADHRVASISYLSPAMAKALSDIGQQVDDAIEAAEQLLPLAKLDSAEEQKVLDDARAFAEELKQFVPEPGPMAAIGFLTDRGIESYQYDWTVRTDLDGSKTLGLMEHVGGNPMLAVVARDSSSPRQYLFLAKWADQALDHVEKLALPRMEEDDRDKLRQVLDLVRPLLKRADVATREMLLPALADGQIALVVDRKLQSKQFIESLPATDSPMPMVEPALIVGVSDGDLLCKAMREYVSVARDLLDGIRGMEGAEIPDEVRIPDPQIETTAGGKLYSYVLPGEWGVNEQIVPNAGLGDGVAVLSLTHDHTRRLLVAQSLTSGGVMAEKTRPRAMAVVFDMAGFIELVKPWVNLGLDQMDDAAAGGQAEAIRQQVGTVLEVLQTVRSITAEAYYEDGVLVTHGLVEVEDVEP